MTEKILLLSIVVFHLVIALPPHVDAVRYKSAKSSSKSSSLKTDGSILRKQSYLRIYARPPKSVTFRENDDEMLECRAGGSPPPVIHWLKDGHLLSEAEWNIVATGNEENFELRTGSNSKLGISSTKSRLYLDCVSLNASGEYTCVSENPYQRISANAAVSVVPHQRQSATGQCKQKTRLGKVPRIVMWTDKRLEFMGGSARLFCRASGFPKPTTQWLDAEGQPVEQDPPKYQILPSGDLVIHNLKWSDMGLYLCIASNIHGSDRIETFLYPTATEK